MDFCAQIAKWAWSIILGMMKTHRNVRMFQKRAKKFKQTSLQGRSHSEIAFALFTAMAGHAAIRENIAEVISSPRHYPP